MTDGRVEQMAQARIDKLRLKDCSGMQDFLNQLEMHRQDIRDAGGEAYSDRQMIPKILSALPDTYRPFIDQHDYLADLPGTPTLTLDGVTTRLLTFESKLAERGTTLHNTTISGKTRKAANTTATPGSKQPKEKTCFTKGCRTWWSHITEDCWKAHPEKRPAKNENTRTTPPASYTPSTPSTQPHKGAWVAFLTMDSVHDSTLGHEIHLDEDDEDASDDNVPELVPIRDAFTLTYVDDSFPIPLGPAPIPAIHATTYGLEQAPRALHVATTTNNNNSNGANYGIPDFGWTSGRCSDTPGTYESYLDGPGSGTLEIHMMDISDANDDDDNEDDDATIGTPADKSKKGYNTLLKNDIIAICERRGITVKNANGKHKTKAILIDSLLQNDQEKLVCSNLSTLELIDTDADPCPSTPATPCPSRGSATPPTLARESNPDPPRLAYRTPIQPSRTWVLSQQTTAVSPASSNFMYGTPFSLGSIMTPSRDRNTLTGIAARRVIDDALSVTLSITTTNGHELVSLPHLDVHQSHQEILRAAEYAKAVHLDPTLTMTYNHWCAARRPLESANIDMDDEEPDPDPHHCLVQTLTVSGDASTDTVVMHTSQRNQDEWIIDSGANTHLANRPEWFDELYPTTETASGPSASIPLKGQGAVKMVFSESENEVILTDTLFASCARVNIISLSRLGKAGMCGEWDGDSIIIRSKASRQLLATAVEQNGLYYLRRVAKAGQQKQSRSPSLYDHIQVSPSLEVHNVARKAVIQAHRRLGHLSFSEIRKLLGHAQGLNFTDKDVAALIGFICPVCAMSKPIIHTPRAPATRVFSEAGDMMVGDIWGPHNYPIGWDGTKLLFLLTDVAQKWTYVARLSGVHQAFRALKICNKKIQRSNGKINKRFRLDNIYNTHETREYCDKHGIELELSAPYGPHQVGVQERGHRTMRERAAAMWQDHMLPGDSDEWFDNYRTQYFSEALPENLWPELACHAIWVKNRSPASSLTETITPWRAKYGVDPDLSNERVWGSPAYAVIPWDRRHGSKLMTPRSRIGYFVGMENETTRRIFDPETGKVNRNWASIVDDGYEDDQEQSVAEGSTDGADEPEQSPELEEELEQNYDDGNTLEDQSDDNTEAPIPQVDNPFTDNPDPPPRHPQNPHRSTPEQRIRKADNPFTWSPSPEPATRQEEPIPRANNPFTIETLQAPEKPAIFKTPSLTQSPVILMVSSSESEDHGGLVSRFFSDGTDGRPTDQPRPVERTPEQQQIVDDLESFRDYDEAYDRLYDVNSKLSHGKLFDALREYSVNKIPTTKKDRVKLLSRLQREDWSDDADNGPINPATSLATTPPKNKRTKAQANLTPSPPRRTRIRSNKAVSITTGPWEEDEVESDDEKSSDMHSNSSTTVPTVILLPKDRACGPCIRRGRKCWRDPNDPDARCEACKGIRICRTQTREDHDAIIEKGKRQKQKTPSRPTGPGPAAIAKKKLAKLATKEKRDASNANKCGPCLAKGRLCEPMETSRDNPYGYCKNCVKNNHRCVPADDTHRAQHAKAILKVAARHERHREAARNNIDTPKHTVPTKKVTTSPKPRKRRFFQVPPKLAVPTGQKCGACKRKGVQCDGGKPCLYCNYEDRKLHCNYDNGDGSITQYRNPNADDFEPNPGGACQKCQMYNESHFGRSVECDAENGIPCTPCRERMDYWPFFIHCVRVIDKDTRVSGRIPGAELHPKYLEMREKERAGRSDAGLLINMVDHTHNPRGFFSINLDDLNHHSSDEEDSSSDITLFSDTEEPNVPTTHITTTHIFATTYDYATAPCPRTFKEAMEGPERDEWLKAFISEIDSLLRAKVWYAVPKSTVPEGFRVLGGRWVTKRKLKPDGSIARYKARYVIRGFMQRQGLDYNETFSAVIKHSSFLIVFAIVAQLLWLCDSMDVMTAFLHGDIEEMVFIQPPEGYEHLCHDGHVLRLAKSIYGLKQSPRVWYTKLHAHLVSLGWDVSAYDPCLFYKKGMGVIAVYVDDLLIAAKDVDIMNDLKHGLSKAFEMVDLGPCTEYLKMQVEHTPGRVHLHQAGYIGQLLRKYNLDALRPVKTPVEPGTELRKATVTIANDEFRSHYQELVGSLNYLATRTRFDISFAFGLVSRYMSNPTSNHLKAVHRIYAYLKATPELGPTFLQQSSTLTVQAWADSAYADCLDTRRSTGGYVFTLNSAPVSWSSKRQKTVAVSTCEAEYVAASEAAKEAIWIQGLLKELDIPIPTINLAIDNEAALRLTRNPEHHERSKHIDVRYHFIRERVQAKELYTVGVKGPDNKADIFTKALPRLKFESGLGRLME
jgi:hypothetical protein